MAAPDRRDLFLEVLFATAADLDWELRAWTVLDNHYHLIAVSPEETGTLPRLVETLHGTTRARFNRRDTTPGRKVWFEYWDSQIKYEPSYLARLNYVHCNAVRHGASESAEAYDWSSAAWFSQNAPAALVHQVNALDAGSVCVPDDF